MCALLRAALALILCLAALGSQADTRLVDTQWLASRLNQPGLVLIDMSDNLQYSRFHLPGAINLPYEYLVQPVKGVSLSIGRTHLVELLGQLGLTADRHIVIYDDTGGLHAARLYWELAQLGHASFAILDGGLVKWVRESRPVSGDVPAIKPTKYQPSGSGIPLSANLDDVRRASDNNVRLLDVRSDEEYAGDKQAKRSGHIPGAHWWPWDQALDIQAGFALHKQQTLRQSLAQAGLDNPDEDIIVYCNSGHRAAHTLFLLRELGFRKVRLYDGSIQEYAKQPSLPLKIGKQP